jgi:cellulose synthase/poly-beta-1,6-N-acetylglucosamine synthase-like glycosyltransferase
VLRREDRAGKADAINRGVHAASSELVCLTDANGSLARGSLQAIVAAFDDPRVAVVAGRKDSAGGGARGAGEGLYWSLECALLHAESVLGCTIAADGGIYAVRRSAFRAIPPHTIADDFEIPLDALERGYLVRHCDRAVAREAVSESVLDEFERRTRIAAGTWQGLCRHISLAHPRRGRVSVAFVSHKLLRSMVVPILLPFCWIGSGVLASRSRLARVLFGFQSVAWVAALFGAIVDSRQLSVPFQFALTNVATLRGGYRYVTGAQRATWRRTTRGKWREAPDSGQPEEA